MPDTWSTYLRSLYKETMSKTKWAPGHIVLESGHTVVPQLPKHIGIAAATCLIIHQMMGDK